MKDPHLLTGRGRMIGWTVLFVVMLSGVSGFSVTPGSTMTRMIVVREPRVASRLYNNNDNNNNNNNNKPSGVYVRPSAAVERGSGFFVPGLEGPRVRLFVGTLLLVATAVNHGLSETNSAFSEALAVLFSGLVLLQGAIESSKETRELVLQVAESSSTVGVGSTTARASSSAILSKQWSTSRNSQDWQDRVEWAATSFLSMTPATHMMLVQDDAIAFWLGATTQMMDSSYKEGAKAALDTIQQSKGGRVALPSDHPVALGFFSNANNDQVYRKCMIVQRITPTACWVVASNDLLASFTKQDLQWLGRMAEYAKEDSQGLTCCFLTKGIIILSEERTPPTRTMQRAAQHTVTDNCLIVDRMPDPLPNPLQHQYYLLRHGQSSANVAAIISSARSNAHSTRHGLTNVGWQQGAASAESLLEALEDSKASGELQAGDQLTFVASPFARAKQTAEACLTEILQKDPLQDRLKALGVKLATTSIDDILLRDNLIERYFGRLDNVSFCRC